MRSQSWPWPLRFWLPASAFLTSEGAIAQLGERVNGIHEVGGSIPPGSTIKSIAYLGWSKPLPDASNDIVRTGGRFRASLPATNTSGTRLAYRRETPTRLDRQGATKAAMSCPVLPAFGSPV